MLSIEYDLRWQGVLRFLSLDDTVAFYEDLWIPFDPNKLSNGLRAILGRWEDQSELYSLQPSLVTYECLHWFEQTFGVEQLLLLVRWADSIYIGVGGSNRVSEWVWSLVEVRVREEATLRERLSTGIVDFLSRLRQKQTKIWAPVEEKLEIQSSKPVSTWDLAAQKMANTNRDADLNKIKLVARQNIAAFCWEQETASLGIEELRELYLLGQKLDSKGEVGAQGNIGFPGGWKFFLLPFSQQIPLAWNRSV